MQFSRRMRPIPYLSQSTRTEPDFSIHDLSPSCVSLWPWASKETPALWLNVQISPGAQDCSKTTWQKQDKLIKNHFFLQSIKHFIQVKTLFTLKLAYHPPPTPKLQVWNKVGLCATKLMEGSVSQPLRQIQTLAQTLRGGQTCRGVQVWFQWLALSFQNKIEICGGM